MQTHTSSSHTRLSWLLFPWNLFFSPSLFECHQSQQVYLINENNTGFKAALLQEKW